MRSSATARAESCAASWTPACAILMICFAIISVRGSSRSLTQRVSNACSYASVMRLISYGSKVELFKLSPSREYALRTVDSPARNFATIELPTRQRFQTKNHL
jgi:hypothetical protein